MSNDHISSSEDGDVFLDYMLRSALTAPGASTSPAAGRILARLLVVIAIEGGADLITPYLVPEPGEPATFEVRAYQPGNLTPTETRSDLDAVAALRTAIRLAREGDAGVEVLSQSPSGLERCVVVRDSTGEFEFRFAGGETLSGDPDACFAARRAWSATLADWRAWVVGLRPTLEAAGAYRSVAATERPRALAQGEPELAAEEPAGEAPGADRPVESEPRPLTNWRQRGFEPRESEPPLPAWRLQGFERDASEPEPEGADEPEVTHPEGVPVVVSADPGGEPLGEVPEAGQPEPPGPMEEPEPPPPDIQSPLSRPPVGPMGDRPTARSPQRGTRPRRPLFRSWSRPAPERPVATEPAQPWVARRDHPAEPADRPEPQPQPEQEQAAPGPEAGPPPVEDLADAWRSLSLDAPAPQAEAEGVDPTGEPPGVEASPEAADSGPEPVAGATESRAPARSSLFQQAADPGPAAPPTPADAEALMAAINEGFAGLSVEVDLGQVEQAIRRALDSDRQDVVEPLARRLATVIRETMERPDTQAMVDSLVPLLPRPGDVAELVTARIADLLSETILRRNQTETAAAPVVSGMMAAVDRFEVQIDGLHDQLRRATGVLETFDERLQASDRRAAVAERTGASIEQDMKRLIRQVDDQVAAIKANAGGGSELTDGVSRLTRKMRESVAQLDRILARLDIVLDAAGAPEEPGMDLLEAGGPQGATDYDVPR